MSLNSALNTAISGLSVNARLADVVTANVANSATKGYGVRRASLATGAFSGVQITKIERHQDAILVRSRRDADATQSYEELRSQTLSKIEIAFGEIDDEGSIASHLNRFDASLIQASSDPFSDQMLSQVSSRLTSLVDRINQASEHIQIIRENADAQIGSLISQLSTDLSELAKLDRSIMSTNDNDLAHASLLDKKQILIDRISTIVPVKELSNSRGVTTLQTDEGFVLYAQKAPTLAFAATPTILADMTLESGGLGAVLLNGKELENGFGKLKGGLIQAAFEARDTQSTVAQSKLDSFAFDLSERLSTGDNSLLAGELGMLTDEGAIPDIQQITGLASRLMVNSTAELSSFRTGLGTGPLAEDGQQLHGWSSGLNERTTLVASDLTSSMTRLASMLSETATQERVLQEEEFTFSRAFAESLKAQELEDGVDTDSELQSLLRIEKAYAANARMVQTIDVMMQTLLDI